MKNHTSEISYIRITHNPIRVKPLKKPNSTFLFGLVKPPNVGYILLILAIGTSLSVFWIEFSPIFSCTSIHHRQTVEKSRDNGLVQLSYVNVSNKKEELPQQQHIANVSNIKVEFGQQNHFMNVSNDEEFWKQPDALGYRPCLEFSDEYIRRVPSNSGNKERRRRFLMVVVSGGLNQQKIQIADAVVVARIVEATLVVPILHVDPVWGDESEFSDIFDEGHFKETLKNDVRVVSTLPASLLRRRPMPISVVPELVHEDWIRTHLVGPLNRNGIVILRAFDSKLSKDLSSDLQKLRCKVAFHALKFRTWIEELGEKLAKRMAHRGPYMALHLRLEKDVWVRTGCLPGLGKKADQVIESERALHPELLKSRTNISARDRYIAGLCPLNAVEITRLLTALGASNVTKIYWAGGTPFEGETALQPLRAKFPFLYNKWALANEGELDHVKHRSSILAAIDYLVCVNSQVFMANHGGNMARSLQGHRAYLGHKKHITPNKKQLVHLFMNKNEENERKFDQLIKEMHSKSLGSPTFMTKKSARDVIAFPVPECMCSRKHSDTSI